MTMSLRTAWQRLLAVQAVVVALLGSGAVQAASITVGAPQTTVPAALQDPLSSLGAGLQPGQILVPIGITGASGLQDWAVDLSFDASVVAPLDLGGLYQGVYQAEFSAAEATLSDITSSGLAMTGVLAGIAGFSWGVSGDGLLAFVLFGFLPDQAGNDPGFAIGTPPAVPVPVPATLAMLMLALPMLGVSRRTRPRAALAAATLAAATLAPAAAQTVANGPYYALPSWGQTMPASTRFIVLANMNQEAVLDRETGLVWQRTPNMTSSGYEAAAYACAGLAATGGRRGWRLPSIAELNTLFDPAAPTTPFLPTGHPFNLPPTFSFWSTTPGPANLAQAGPSRFGVSVTASFLLFSYATTYFNEGPFNAAAAWCVRGPGQAN